MSSVTAISWAAQVECETPGQKLILLLLAVGSGGNGTLSVATPSVERLAHQSGYSYPEVRRFLDDLIRSNLITPASMVRKKQDAPEGLDWVAIGYGYPRL